ncbi:MAG: glycosyltransferase [Bacteroidota bacterium]
MSTPRILRIINRFNLGGPTFNAAYLTKYLEPEFETLLLGGQKDDSEASSEFIVNQLGLQPRILSSMKRNVNAFNDFHSYREIKKIIREFKPDIVHTHASKAGAVGRMAAFHCKVPATVHTFHGNVFKGYFGPLRTSLVKKTERFLAKRTTAIIAISELQKKELVSDFRICAEEKVHVIPLGFDLSRFRENQEEKRKKFREKYLLGDDEIAISIIGRLVPIKNHRLFISAVCELQKKTNRKIRAFVVGDGECMNDLKGFCSENDVEFALPGEKKPALITFTSWIREADEVNAGSEIIALSSDNEGTPVSLIEAQAAGKPVVSTRVGGVENVVNEGVTGLLSPSGEKEGLVQNLLQLAENESLRIKMGNEGWHRVESKYHYTRLVEETKNLYYSLLKPSGFQ